MGRESRTTSVTARSGLDAAVVDPLALHRDASVFLAYTNPAMRFAKDAVDAGWFAEDDPRVQGGLANLRRGDVDISVVSVGVHTVAQGDNLGTAADRAGQPAWGPVCTEAETVRMMLRFLDALINVVEANPTQCAIARTMAEARQIHAGGRMAIFLHCTGAWVNGDLAVLRTYYRLGVRSVHICVEGLSGVGDPSDDVPVYGGLSDFGRKIVLEMNRLGMVIDVSHASDASARQIIELSDAPVISSHTCCRALCEINRNLPDDLLKMIAHKGGVIGMHFASAMIVPPPPKRKHDGDRLATAYRDRQRRLRSKYLDPYEFLAASLTMEAEQEIAEEAAIEPDAAPCVAKIEQLIDHIDHVVEVAGVDHVGVGTDYDIGNPPQGLESASKLCNLTAALIQRGYSEGEIRKILGGNFERVFGQILDA